MSESEAARFMDSIQTDKGLSDMLDGLKENPRAVFHEIQARGFQCTPEEIKTEFLEYYGHIMSDEDLKAIAAGHSPNRDMAIGLGVVAGLAVVGAAAAAF